MVKFAVEVQYIPGSDWKVAETLSNFTAAQKRSWAYDCPNRIVRLENGQRILECESYKQWESK